MEWYSARKIEETEETGKQNSMLQVVALWKIHCQLTFHVFQSLISGHKQHSIDTNVQALLLNTASYKYKSMAYTKQIMFPMFDENFK